MFSWSIFSCSMFLIRVLYSHGSCFLGRYFLVTCFPSFTCSFPRSLLYAVSPSSPGPHLLIHVCPPGCPYFPCPCHQVHLSLVYISLISVLSYPYSSGPRLHATSSFHNSCMLSSGYKSIYKLCLHGVCSSVQFPGPRFPDPLVSPLHYIT